MTALACTKDFVMVNSDHWSKCRSVVAGFTEIIREYMTHGFADGSDVIMAGNTGLAHHAAVIKCTINNNP